jgi:hypothetical protein
MFHLVIAIIVYLCLPKGLGQSAGHAAGTNFGTVAQSPQPERSVSHHKLNWKAIESVDGYPNQKLIVFVLSMTDNDGLLRRDRYASER